MLELLLQYRKEHPVLWLIDWMFILLLAIIIWGEWLF